MVPDKIESTLYIAPPVEHKKKPPENVFKVYFSNKAPELVDLPISIWNSQSVSLLKNLP